MLLEREKTRKSASAQVAAFFTPRARRAFPWELTMVFACAYAWISVISALLMLKAAHPSVHVNNPFSVTALVVILAIIATLTKLNKVQLDASPLYSRIGTTVEALLAACFLLATGLGTGFEISSAVIDAENTEYSVLQMLISREHALYFVAVIIIGILCAVLYSSESLSAKNGQDLVRSTVNRIDTVVRANNEVLRSPWYQPEVVEDLLEMTKARRPSPANLALFSAHVVRLGAEITVTAGTLFVLSLGMDFAPHLKRLTFTETLAFFALCLAAYSLWTLTNISIEFGFFGPVKRPEATFLRVAAVVFGLLAVLLMVAIGISFVDEQRSILPFIDADNRSLLWFPLTMSLAVGLVWLVDFIDPIYRDHQRKQLFDGYATKSPAPSEVTPDSLPDYIDEAVSNQRFFKQLTAIGMAAELGGLISRVIIKRRRSKGSTPGSQEIIFDLHERRSMRTEGCIRSLRFQAYCNKVAYDQVRQLVADVERLASLRSGYAAYDSARAGEVLSAS